MHGQQNIKICENFVKLLTVTGRLNATYSRNIFLIPHHFRFESAGHRRV